MRKNYEFWQNKKFVCIFILCWRIESQIFIHGLTVVTVYFTIARFDSAALSNVNADGVNSKCLWNRSCNHGICEWAKTKNPLLASMNGMTNSIESHDAHQTEINSVCFSNSSGLVRIGAMEFIKVLKKIRKNSENNFYKGRHILTNKLFCLKEITQNLAEGIPASAIR